MMKPSVYLAGVAFSACLFLSTSYGAADWEKLQDCRLIPNESNDGDSFHVLHDGKEYIFRLYFVDCPETDDHIPDRVAEQAAYFGIDNDTVYEMGHRAAEFTRSELSHHFTVYTRWEDAMGASRLPRYYAFIDIDGKDLAEMLAEEGLIRVHGMMVDSPRGGSKSSFEDRLTHLADKAKEARAGIWAHVREEKKDTGGAGGLLTRDEIMEKFDVTKTPAALPEKVVCANAVPAYTVETPFEQLGYFQAGAELKIVRYIDRSMVEVKFTSPSGKVTAASCKYWELGLAQGTSVQ